MAMHVGFLVVGTCDSRFETALAGAEDVLKWPLR